MDNNGWPSSLGVVGLGIMGSAISRHLATAGRRVIGFDTDGARCGEAQAAGAEIAASATSLAAESDLVLTSLPSAPALEATIGAILAAPRRPGQVVTELSTLSLDDKYRGHARLAAVGIPLLDCPVSGTGAQAANRDIVLYASGDVSSFERSRGAFADFARESLHLGAFGNGTKMKFVANLLVAIHNVATAEAILLGLRAGLDAGTLVQVLGSGAGSSRMLQLRGPMMVRHAFEPATMKLDVWQKDMQLIEQFARDTGVVTPLFSTTAPLFAALVARGRGHEDTAAVYSVLEEMVPVRRG